MFVGRPDAERFLPCYRARAGASDLPQVAALLGGMVAQETIKLVTRQYVPVNGTVIYDGIKSVIGGLNV